MGLSQPAERMILAGTSEAPTQDLVAPPGPGCAALAPVECHDCRTQLSNDLQRLELQGQLTGKGENMAGPRPHSARGMGTWGSALMRVPGWGS